MNELSEKGLQRLLEELMVLPEKITFKPTKLFLNEATIQFMKKNNLTAEELTELIHSGKIKYMSWSKS